MSVPTTDHPYLLGAGEGPALWHLGALLRFKATSETTAGRLWLQEAEGERGYAAPVHRHSREDEAFYVLDGELSMYVGDNCVSAGAGAFLWAPRGIPHAFCVESDRARFLAFSTSAGLDRFFFATGEPAGDPTTPPHPDRWPDVEELIRVMGEYGVEMVGPPPTPRT